MTILVAAWVSIGLDAPLWVTVAAVGVFLAKSFLDLFLIFHYRNRCSFVEKGRFPP